MKVYNWESQEKDIRCVKYRNKIDRPFNSFESNSKKLGTNRITKKTILKSVYHY